MKAISAALLVITTILFCSCANHFDTTRRMADPPATIAKVFVAVRTGNQQHSSFADEIIAASTKQFNDCGIQVMSDSAAAANGTLSLSDAPGHSLKERIQAFAPDYVLYIQDYEGQPFFKPEGPDNRYEAFIHLPHAPIGQNIWYTQFTMPSAFGLNNGTTLANKIFRQMRGDRMLPASCADKNG